jgi:hypothetical protein
MVLSIEERVFIGAQRLSERTVFLLYDKVTFFFSECHALKTLRARIPQSVQRLATGWAVWGSNPGGYEIFRTRSDRPWGPPSLLYGSFPGVKRPGRGADHPPPF